MSDDSPMVSSAPTTRHALVARRSLRDTHVQSRMLFLIGLVAVATLLFDRLTNLVLSHAGGQAAGQFLPGQGRGTITFVAVLGLIGLLVRVRELRLRLHEATGVDGAYDVRRRTVRRRASWRDLRDTVAVRTGVFGIAAIAVTSLQVSVEGGSSTTVLHAAIPPIALLGYAFIAGLIAAVVSVLGLQTLECLHRLVARMRRRRIHQIPVPELRAAIRALSAQLSGSGCSSRGPPAPCGAAA